MDLSPQKPPVAVLIDGENLSHTHAETVLTNARRYGDPIIRRAYGKADAIAPWADHGFRMVATRPAKNAADLLLAVEAMSLALKDQLKTLIIASSDGDFSHLASHLREQGHRLIGMGENKAPAAFRNACSEFTILQSARAKPPPTVPPAALASAKKDLTRWVKAYLAAAGATGVAIVDLNIAARGAGFLISETPEKTWRNWLQADARKTLVQCDPKGPTAHVRLINPAPHTGP